jgi:hypothetical protein
MKKSFTLVILIIFGFILFFCNGINKKNKSVLNNKYGSVVDLIDTLMYFNLNEGWISKPFQYPHKITTYIDGDCNQCLYELLSWKEIMDEFENDEVSFLFYVKTPDLEELVSFLVEIEFQYPIIIDYEGTYKTKNSIGEDKTYQTFLVDGNSKIMLIGNPLFSSQIEDLYISTIKKLI